MMMETVLVIPQTVYSALEAHLLRDNSKLEEVGFLFAHSEPKSNKLLFQYMDWFPVPPEGFEHRSSFYCELTDDTRASMIKRAHDLKTSLIEFHSHTGSWPAQFSLSDFEGFDEFVPHVWWRLKGRPYAAVVVTRTGFDALAWVDNPESPQQLSGIRAGDRLLHPTGLSLQKGGFYHDNKIR